MHAPSKIVTLLLLIYLPLHAEESEILLEYRQMHYSEKTISYQEQSFAVLEHHWLGIGSLAISSKSLNLHSRGYAE